MARLLVMLSSLQGGGAERVATAIASQLLEQHHEVLLLTIAGTDLDQYALPADVQRVALDMYQDSRNPLHGVWLNIKRTFATRQVLRTHKPDRILSFLPECNVTAILASRGLGIPVIVSERNYPPKDVIAAHWRFLRKHTYPHAETVVAVSTQIGNWLTTAQGLRNVVTIPNAVNWPLSDNQPHIDPDSFLADDYNKFILACGRLVHQKGFDMLIDAFAKIASELDGWKLLVAGDTDDVAYRQQLQQKINHHGLGDSVHFVGRVGNMARWMERADLFVLSSRYEGFPNVLLEAMAAGKGVASFDCDSGPGELIVDGENGLLVADGDVQALADALQSLACDEGLRRRLGQAAADVRQRYAMHTLMKRWLKVLGTDTHMAT